MIVRPISRKKRAFARPAAGGERRAADDARFNDEMTRIMTDAADLRAERERVRSGENDRLARSEADAIEDLIRRHPRGRIGSTTGEARAAAQDLPEVTR